MAQATQRHVGSLAKDAIGLPEVVLQSITFMAPAAGVALALIPGANFAGGALPLSVLLALAGCLLVASSIAQLAKHMPSAVPRPSVKQGRVG